MSRGRGKVQRQILEELERRQYAYLADLLPEGATKATYNSFSRAALKLADEEVIECKTFICGTLGFPKTLLSMPGKMPKGRPPKADGTGGID